MVIHIEYGEHREDKIISGDSKLIDLFDESGMGSGYKLINVGFLEEDK